MVCNFVSLLEVYSVFLFFVFRLPSNVKKVFHPIICCALSADLTAFAFGYFSKSGLDPVLGMIGRSLYNFYNM